MIQILEFEREIFKLENQIQEMVSLSHMYDSVGDITHEITRLHKKVRHMKHDVYSNLKGWQKTQVARHPDRPHTLCLLYTSPSPRDVEESRMPSSA